MQRKVIWYNDAPPSSNKNNGVGGRGNPHAIAKTKEKWEQIWGTELMIAMLPRNLRFIHVTPLIEYRTANRRDEDNLYFPVSKPFGDICVKRGHIPDDTPEFYKCEAVVIQVGVTTLPPRVKAVTTLTLDYR